MSLVNKISMGAAKKLVKFDQGLPSKVEYLLLTKNIKTPPKNKYLDPLLTLALASFIVSSVGVTVQVIDFISKEKEKNKDTEKKKQIIQERIEKPSFLSSSEYDEILDVIFNESNKI